MTKHRNTDYSIDSLIGAGADIAPRPDEQAAVTRLLSACGAGDLAECLGLTG
jgi:hypothetical protein